MKGKGATSKAGQAASQKTLRKAVGAAVNEALKLQVLFAIFALESVLAMLNIRTFNLQLVCLYPCLASKHGDIFACSLFSLIPWYQGTVCTSTNTPIESAQWM